MCVRWPRAQRAAVAVFPALCRNQGQTTGILVVQHINQRAAAMHDAEKERKLHIINKIAKKINETSECASQRGFKSQSYKHIM